MLLLRNLEECGWRLRPYLNLCCFGGPGLGSGVWDQEVNGLVGHGRESLQCLLEVGVRGILRGGRRR